MRDEIIKIEFYDSNSIQGLVTTPVVAGDDLLGYIIIKMKDWTRRKDAVRYPDGNSDPAHFIGKLVRTLAVVVCMHVCMYV